MSLHWVALKTTPHIIHRTGPIQALEPKDLPSRVEFHVLYRITQNEHPGLLPFETVFEKRPGKRHPVKRRYALFPRYVFCGLADVLHDYSRLRKAIPEIQGIISRSRDDWSPLVLSPGDVETLQKLVNGAVTMTEISIHKGLAPGKRVNVEVGSTLQETKIDEVTKKGVKVLLNMLGSMHVVEVPFDKVRAA